MKKIVFMALAALFVLSCTLEAQGNRQGPPERRLSANDRAESLAKQLDLSDEQKTQVVALFELQDAKRKEQMEAEREKREEMEEDLDKQREEMKALREKEMLENDAALEAIIGTEKMEQYKEERAKQQKRMQRRPDRRPPSL